MSSVLSARGRLGAAQRHHPEQIDDALRDLAAAKIEQYVSEIVEASPRLTEKQRARISALLERDPA